MMKFVLLLAFVAIFHQTSAANLDTDLKNVWGLVNNNHRVTGGSGIFSLGSTIKKILGNLLGPPALPPLSRPTDVPEKDLDQELLELLETLLRLYLHDKHLPDDLVERLTFVGVGLLKKLLEALRPKLLEEVAKVVKPDSIIL